MTHPDAITIVGAGHAAGQMVASLRQGGFAGTITLFGDEAHLPYQRPPLSKSVLKGELEPARALLKPESWYVAQTVDVRGESRVASIDRAARTLALEDGTQHAFDRLILATGSRPIALPVPGADLPGVHDLRTLDDAMAIRAAAAAGRRAVIVGGGYIGLEAAASLRTLGLEVAVLERESRVLARVTSPMISEFFESLHARHNVDLRTGCSAIEIVGERRAERVLLDNGDALPCDLVLVGIGITPNVELARSAGLTCDDGIVVDRDARTDDAAIYAIGDCTQRELVHYGRRGRLESVHNALEQAKLASAHILGTQRPEEDCPWFWSDQFDVKLQIAGLSAGYDDLLVRGDPGSRHFAALYLRAGILIAVDAVNSPRDFMPSKTLIARRVACDPVALVDPSVPLKSLF